MRTQLIASALLLVVNTSAYARDLNPFTDEGAAAAGLIQFYSQRCGSGPGYFLTSSALAFVHAAANARPKTFHAGYATEAHMPTQDCAGAYAYNLGPKGVISTATGFTILQATGRATQ
jgi:hypothetical protein